MNVFNTNYITRLTMGLILGIGPIFYLEIKVELSFFYGVH